MTKISAWPAWRPGTPMKWIWFWAMAMTGSYEERSPQEEAPASPHVKVSEDAAVRDFMSRKNISPLDIASGSFTSQTK